MGFRTATVIVTTCFMLGRLRLYNLATEQFSAEIFLLRACKGVLLMGLASADWPILYSSERTPEDVIRAERYYLTLFDAPSAVSALLHAMVCDL